MSIDTNPQAQRILESNPQSHRIALVIEKKPDDRPNKTKKLLEDLFDTLRAEDGKNGRDAIVNYEWIVKKVLSLIGKPKDGYTPIKGKDYFDGQDADEQAIIKKVLSQIPKPKNGSPGKNGISPTINYEKIISEVLNKLPERIPDIPKIHRKVKELEQKHKNIEKALSFQSSSPQTSYGGEISKLKSLVDDVNIATPVNGQVLTYNSTTGKWVNSASAGGGTPTGDIDLTLYDTGDHIHFTLPSTPLANTFNLYRGGAKQTTIASDYTLVGTALTLATALETGNSLIGNWST